MSGASTALVRAALASTHNPHLVSGLVKHLARTYALAVSEAAATKVGSFLRGVSARRAYRQAKHRRTPKAPPKVYTDTFATVALPEDTLNAINISNSLNLGSSPGHRSTNRIFLRGLRYCLIANNTDVDDAAVLNIAVVVPKAHDSIGSTEVKKRFFTSMGSNTDGYDCVDFDSVTISKQSKNCLPIYSGAWKVLHRKRFFMERFTSAHLAGQKLGMTSTSTNYCEGYIPINMQLTYQAGQGYAQRGPMFVYWMEPLRKGAGSIATMQIDRKLAYYFKELA